jgi:hypothetical protein
MAGKRKMKMPADTSSVRQMLWRSMRIMTKFTIAGLMRTIPEETTVKYANVQKFVRRLVQHGYVAKDGGYKGGNAGTAQGYRLVNNIGPTMPVLNIGRAENLLSKQCKNAAENTQTETDTQGDTP